MKALKDSIIRFFLIVKYHFEILVPSDFWDMVILAFSLGIAGLAFKNSPIWIGLFGYFFVILCYVLYRIKLLSALGEYNPDKFLEGKEYTFDSFESYRLLKRLLKRFFQILKDIWKTKKR
jgi:hypothetical protein